MLNELQLSDRVFIDGDASNSVDLANPVAVATLAHEVFHNWQRLRGTGPTGEGILVQPLNSLGLIDAYGYDENAQEAQMFTQFMGATAEQQAAIFADYVYYAELAASGHSDALRAVTRYRMVAQLVKSF